VYGINYRRVSEVMEKRKKKKRVRVVVCEYIGSVVGVYGEEGKECECGCGEEREEERNKSRKEEDVM
jgi:hypothetical protein